MHIYVCTWRFIFLCSLFGVSGNLPKRAVWEFGEDSNLTGWYGTEGKGTVCQKSWWCFHKGSCLCREVSCHCFDANIFFSFFALSLSFCVFLCACSCVCVCFPGALQIENSEETDQGKYECVASNVEGVRYSSPANLYVRGREQRSSGAKENLDKSSLRAEGKRVKLR